MARQMNAINQAMLYLEVIKRIPRHRFISSVEMQNSLRAAGIEVQTLTLQRYLKQLYDSGNCLLSETTRVNPIVIGWERIQAPSPLRISRPKRR